MKPRQPAGNRKVPNPAARHSHGPEEHPAQGALTDKEAIVRLFPSGRCAADGFFILPERKEHTP